MVRNCVKATCLARWSSFHWESHVSVATSAFYSRLSSLQRSTLQTSTWGAPAWLSAFWIQQGNVRASAYFFVFSPLPHPCPLLCPITPDFFSTWSYPVSCDCGDLGSKTPLKTFRHFSFSFFTSFLLVLCCLWLLVLPCYRK